MDECKHKYRILDIVYKKREQAGYQHYYERITTYYCIKCLAEVIRKTECEGKK